jgi:outer membrane protein assembly factor BamA
MRVRVGVEEWPTLRLRYGLQVAEEHPEGKTTGRDLTPGLSADVTRRTLFGRAIGLGGAVNYQRRERAERAFLNSPTFIGLPVESVLSVEHARSRPGSSSRIDDRIELSSGQQMNLRRELQISYGYRFQHSRTELPSDPIIGPFPPIVLNVARLNASAAWDTRNDAGDTTRGSLVSDTLEYAPESLGSDIRFVRHLAQAYHFRPWRRVVFASAARFGVVQPLGGQELISFVKFFAGGARTVRGVSEEGLGDRDVFGDPAGGEALLVLNQEVRFPIYRWFRGVGFVDAGNVFTKPADIGLNKLTGSLGLGIRFATPVALLRVDYGRTVWPGAQSPSSRWVFGIGQAF